MNDKKEHDKKDQQKQNPSTPSQAEGDEDTIDQALSNSEQQDNFKKQQ